MTLKSVLKVLIETKYRIVAHYTKSDTYDTVTVAYLTHDKDGFTKGLLKEMELENTKNRVKYISYNKAENCVEIDIEIDEVGR